MCSPPFVKYTKLKVVGKNGGVVSKSPQNQIFSFSSSFMKHISNIKLTNHIILKRNEVLIKHLDLFNSSVNIINSNHRTSEY